MTSRWIIVVMACRRWLLALAACLLVGQGSVAGEAFWPDSPGRNNEGEGRKDVVLFWNVENLFDCRHDTLKNDYDFLPEGSHLWTRRRYWHKLDDVSRTLAAVAEEEGQWPSIVGLCEVENDTVLHDLTRRSTLRRAGYEYVMTESGDERGVDVALLYQPERFRLLGFHSVRVPSVQHGFHPTRDILCVSGRLPAGDTLHVVVVHLPSRAGYHKGSGRHRKLAVQTLRHTVDSLAGKPVLVMGDFNSEPRDPLFRQLCPPLRSLMPQQKRELRKAQGTYFFQGQWGYLDHILVSDTLFRKVRDGRARPLKYSFLLDEQGRPWRTFRGPSYAGGFSDHLPLKAVLCAEYPE